MHAYMIATLPPANLDLSAHWENVAVDSLPLLSEGEVRALLSGSACLGELCCRPSCRGCSMQGVTVEQDSAPVAPAAEGPPYLSHTPAITPLACR